MPETIHTSPFHVHSAARPSEKKSTPPNRSHEWYGLSSGAVIVSSTYGCVVLLLISPLVTTGFVHRGSPALTSASMSSFSAMTFFRSSGLTVPVRLKATRYVVASLHVGNTR